MQIKGIYDLNQVFGFEVYQDQKQPREKTSRSGEENQHFQPTNGVYHHSGGRRVL